MVETERPEQPAAGVPVTLFRQILLVPFALEATDRVRPQPDQLRRQLARTLRDDPEGRWRRQSEPLFHLPEDDLPADLPRDVRARRLAAAYEEFVYFEPYVQDFLFGTPERVQLDLWQATALHALEVEHDLGEPSADTSVVRAVPRAVATFRFRVERANLYLFPTANALLVVELHLERQSRGGQEVVTTLDHAQSLLESVRRTFPPYFTRTDRSHGDPDAGLETRYFVQRMRLLDKNDEPLWQADCTVDPTSTILGVVGTAAPAPKVVPLFEPWRRLLEPLAVKGLAGSEHAEVVLAQLGDDRAFVLAQIGVPDPHAIGQSDWVRLCFLDTPGTGLPYARHFLRRFEEDHCYDRFFDRTPHEWQTTRYLVCNYAMVVVGKAAPEPDDGCFFRHVIAKHVRRQYFQLVLIALLQRTAIKTLSDRITEVPPGDGEAMTRIQREVLNFTHRYWFEDISAQNQGQELFALLRRRLRLRRLYEQLAQESREANAVAVQDASRSEQKKQGELATAAQSLNVIAGVGLAASVIVGFFGMNVFREGHEFLTADAPFVAGLAVALAGAFSLLFLCRDRLIDWLARSCWRRFLVRYAAALAVALGVILAFGRGP